MSFFLWRSLPDDELIEVAARGQLREDAVLARQVRRMLADRRATRFMNDFVGQWLQVRNIHGQAPDGALFAGFNDTLRKAMVRETELFFESQVREDRPIPDLLRADYTYLNEQLARHYGVPGHLREPVSPRDVARRPAAGPAGPRQRADGHLVCQPDLSGPARQVGPRDPAGRAAAAAAAQRAAAAGE